MQSCMSYLTAPQYVNPINAFLSKGGGVKGFHSAKLSQEV